MPRGRPNAYRVNGKFAVVPGQQPKPKGPPPVPGIDGRSRIARRLRQLERELRNAVTRQGRVIDIGVDIQIGAAAQAALQCEIIKVKRAHGEAVADDVATRWLNTLDRALNRLNLTALVLEPPRPLLPLRERLAAEAGA